MSMRWSTPPRGSRAKLEFDPKLGAFTLAKPLLVGLTYPYDWEFTPSPKWKTAIRSTNNLKSPCPNSEYPHQERNTRPPD